ncbi:MAG TPA: toll/interleukin-1 receptor domain-containing protein [Thermoanaerobaculia bacterium]|nr:toll/interleukin-1 receptor domain-containing protein [Thermoanaerobaculia bacterium]
MNMPRDEAIRVLQSGRVHEWNHRRDPSDWLPDLASVDLSGRFLAHANLAGAGFNAANFSRAQLSYADLREADLKGANLCEAQLFGANLAGADLTDADLRRAALDFANLSGATIGGTDFSGSRMQATILTDLDLSGATGLETVWFFGPCSIDRRTFVASKGNIAPSFLLSCGLDHWELPLVKLYDAALTKQQADRHLLAAHRLLIQLNGLVFISYAHQDSAFVDKLYEVLQASSHAVWLDRKNSTAGDIGAQVREHISRAGAVVVVLSQHSFESQWVELEVSFALDLERRTKQQLLCPISVDHFWSTKSGDIWRDVASKVVIDFSNWSDDDAFSSSFRQLEDGLRSYF